MEQLLTLENLLALRHPDGDGDRPRDRQHRLPRDPHRQAPAEQQARARRIGLFLAMFMRIALLLTLTWIMRLTQPLFAVLGHAVSGRDLILLVGGSS